MIEINIFELENHIRSKIQGQSTINYVTKLLKLFINVVKDLDFDGHPEKQD